MKYFIVALLLASCRSADSNDEDIIAIKNILQQERQAHFNKDVNLFLSEFAPGMYSVNKGVVAQLPIEEHRKKVEAYFNSVKFIKWDDFTEPVIKFSDDHSLAYAIVQKLVILETKDSAGKITMDTTNFAWTSIYRKHQNGWKLECDISTNK
jgi:hypothetical protein